MVSNVSSVFWEDEECTVIYDKFPKARIHLLVLPNRKIEALKDLSKQEKHRIHIDGIILYMVFVTTHIGHILSLDTTSIGTSSLVAEYA